MLRKNLNLASILLLAAVAPACRQGDVARLPESKAATVEAPKPAPAPAATTTAAAPATAQAGDLPAPPTGASFFSGTTEAHRRSTLTPKVSSAVLRVHVRDGDIVKEGQPLVTLDTQDFNLRLQQAEAGLQAAKVQLDSAKLDWNRTKSLLDDKAVPQSQFDMVDARYKGAQAGVLQAETAVAMGRKALRDATVHAPFSGIIVKRMVNEGEYATVMPATPLVIIEEVNPIDLRVQIPSTEMGKVKEGDMLHVRFPATGQVTDVRLTRVVAALDPHTRTFSAIAEIPNADRSMRTGLYAEVTVSGKSTTQEGTSGKSKKLAARTKPAKDKKD